MRWVTRRQSWLYRREFGSRISTIRVLGSEWTVRYERPKAMIEDKQSLLGQALLTQTTIRISTAQSVAAERDTLLHELLHSIWYVMGVDPPENATADFEEYVVARMATGVLCVLRDNPHLVTYLTNP